MQRQGKVRRFIWRFIKITLLSVLLLLVVFYSVLQMHSVQTWLGKEASAYLSKKLNTKIYIEAIRINFFSKVNLEGIYVEDLHRDTLLYGNKLECDIELLSFTDKKLELDLTHVNGITFKLQKYKGEKDFNFQFLADYFASGSTPEPDTSKSGFLIHYGDLKLSTAHFLYKDHNDTSRVAYGVNYSDIEARHINGDIKHLTIDDGLIKCQLENFSFSEKSGFNLVKLYAEATISPKSIRADNLYLVTPNSYLHGYYQMHTDSFGSYTDFVNKVRLDVKFTDSSFVNPQDISYFAPFFKGFDERINLSGTIKGPVYHLRSDQLDFSVFNHTGFSGSVDIKGLPDIDSTYLKVNAHKLSTCYWDLERIPAYPFDEGKKMIMPQNMKVLGITSFSGKAQGFLHDLSIAGNISTSVGDIFANANLKTPKDKPLEYSGEFKTDGFNLGSFLQFTPLGSVALSAKIGGKGTDPNTLEVEVNGLVHSAQFNGFTYHGLDVNGEFKNRLFSGSFSSADSNAHFNFVGKADLQGKIPQLDADIEIFKLDLYHCNFLKSDSLALLSGHINTNISGDNIDNLNGYIKAPEIRLIKSNGLVSINDADIQITQNENGNNLTMISSVLDADVNGHFNSKTLSAGVSNFLHEYFPTFFKEKIVIRNERDKKAKALEDNFKFRLRVKDFEPIATFLKLPLKISSNTLLQGSFDSQKSKMVMSGISDLIEFDKIPVKDWFLSLNTLNRQVELNTGFKRIDIADSLYLANFNVKLGTTDTRSEFEILWDNQSKRKNAGEITGGLNFSQYFLDLDITKFNVFVSDSLWKRVGSDHFFADSSGTFNFSDLTFVNGQQKIKLEGVVSKDPRDQISIELDQVKLDQVNPVLKNKGAELDGTLSGKVVISDLYNKVIFTSGLDFDQLKVNNTLIGNGEINSLYDIRKELVSLNGFFKRDFKDISQNTYNNINFDGYYYPNKTDSALDINIHLAQFALNTIQPVVKGIFTLNQGYINGELNIGGSVKKPLMRGEMELNNVRNFRVDYLNVPYEIKSGKIKIEPDEITFDFVPLYDPQGNKAVVYGNIFHDNFSNMKLDFDINTTNFMALNTTALQNSSYYGKAYCTGNIGLYGPPESLIFEINAKTAKGTQFFIPLSGPGEVSENGFIRFVKKDSLNKKAHTDKNDFSGITLKFNLEVTPNAEVQLLLDAKSGDAIKARGIGNFNMNISTLGNFEMFGTYDILDGSYLFTLENVINKKFDIDEGSNIRWSGDPLNADINITATYKQRTSLAAFFPQTQTTSTPGAGGGSSANAGTGVDNNKRYPVSCKLFMRDKLLSPDITFGIELPGVSEVIRSQVMGYINNDQELNRQVFSLLLLRTFVTPLQLSNPSGVSAGDAVGNNASELLSNQLNNWLSHFTKLFNMGVNYRPGGAQSNEELDVNLNTSLFNDKLTIDGNVGVNNNTQTKTSTLIGDLNINYKLTNDGKIQLKAFNRSNDNFQIATLGGQFTQGAGIFYREEFNDLNDLYIRYLGWLRSKKKKAPEGGQG